MLKTQKMTYFRNSFGKKGQTREKDATFPKVNSPTIVFAHVIFFCVDSRRSLWVNGQVPVGRKTLRPFTVPHLQIPFCIADPDEWSFWHKVTESAFHERGAKTGPEHHNVQAFWRLALADADRPVKQPFGQHYTLAENYCEVNSENILLCNWHEISGKISSKHFFM